MSTAELLRSEDLRTAEVLADQIQKELGSVFAALVTSQQLIKTLNLLLLEKPPGIGGEHEDEIIKALGRMDAVEDLDVWEIENGSQGAQTVRDLLEITRKRQERQGEDRA